MIVSNCPRCNEEFRVPSGNLPEDAYAQCPWCRESFPLADVQKTLPPMLEVMSADGQPIRSAQQLVTAGLSGAASTDDADFFRVDEGADETRGEESGQPDTTVDPSSATAETVVEEDFPSGLEFEDADSEDLDATVGSETVSEETVTDDTWNQEQSGFGVAEEDEDLGEYQIKDPHGARAGDQQSAPMDSMKVSSRPKRKQKQGSGIRTAIGVVLGGVAAIPVAGGLLMALGQTPDWGFWPFNGPGSSRPSVVAAPPVDLSSRSEQETSTGRSLSASLNDDAANATTDPADLALEGIIGDSNNADQSQAGENDEFATAQSSLRLPDEGDQAEPDSAIAIPPSATIADSPVEIVAIDADEDPVAPQAAITRDSATETFPDKEMGMLEPPTQADVVAEIGVPAIDVPAINEFEPPPLNTKTANVAEETSSIEVSKPSPESKSIASANQALEALVGFQGTEKQRKKQLAMTYAKIAAACELASGQEDGLGQLAAKIGSSDLKEEIAYAGSLWLDYRGRNSDGIALIGRPGSGDQRQTITLESGKIVALAGETSLPTAEEVLVMGRIADDASTVNMVFAHALP